MREIARDRLDVSTLRDRSDKRKLGDRRGFVIGTNVRRNPAIPPKVARPSRVQLFRSAATECASLWCLPLQCFRYCGIASAVRPLESLIGAAWLAGRAPFATPWNPIAS